MKVFPFNRRHHEEQTGGIKVKKVVSLSSNKPLESPSEVQRDITDSRGDQVKSIRTLDSLLSFEQSGVLFGCPNRGWTTDEVSGVP